MSMEPDGHHLVIVFIIIAVTTQRQWQDRPSGSATLNNSGINVVTLVMVTFPEYAITT
jgi:hypothetical protein